MTSYLIAGSIKKILKKAWAWIKKNWKFISGIVVAFIIMAIARKGPNLRSVISRIKEDYEKEISIIEKAHKKEKIILENSKNPDEITRRISEITGFEIHVS